METEFWLIRHAPVRGPSGVIHATDAPVDLSARQRIELLRRTLPADASTFCSPSVRTVQTADALGLRPKVIHDLREQDFGTWTGRTHAELERETGANYNAFWKAPATTAPPEGESFVQQIERTRRVLTSITADRVILVVHSGTIRAALAIALALPVVRALSFVLDPLSLTRLDRVGADWRIGFVNESGQTSTSTECDRLRF